MKRIAIDTMIVDKIMETPGVLERVQAAGAAGKLSIVGSHIIRDQLEATPDPDHRQRLLSTYEGLPLKSVPTWGAVWGVSKYNQSLWGDGAETGIPIDEARTRGRGALQDALIATTAAGEADVLVTDEWDLTKRVKRSGAQCEVWRFAQFAAFVGHAWIDVS